MNDENTLIAELRARQKQAIDVLDFKYARQIDEEITDIKAGNGRKNKQSVYQPYLDMLQTYLEEFDTLVEEKNLEFFNEEKCIRAKFEQKFKQAQTRHMKLLTEIQMKQVKAFLKERSRPIPEYESMISNAKKAAASGDFDLAEQIRDNSSEVAQIAYQQREQVIQGKYDVIQNNALNTMSTEIQTLASLLERALTNLNTKKDFAFRDLYNSREIQISSIHQKFTLAWTKQTPIAKKCTPVADFNSQFEAICNSFNCPIPDSLLVGEKRIGPHLTKQTIINRESKVLTPKKRAPNSPANRSASPTIKRGSQSNSKLYND